MKTNTACIAVMAASAALGLTGCAWDTRAAKPKVTTPASAVASRAPSPTTTSTTPPGPSPARAQEAEAIALVRSYVDEFNKALKSGSTTAFRATFNKDCAICLGDATTIDGYVRSHKEITGGAYMLIAPAAIRTPSGQIWVQAQLSQAAARILDKNGHTLDKFAVVPRFGFTWKTKSVPGGPLIIFDSVPS